MRLKAQLTEIRGYKDEKFKLSRQYADEESKNRIPVDLPDRLRKYDLSKLQQQVKELYLTNKQESKLL